MFPIIIAGTAIFTTSNKLYYQDFWDKYLDQYSNNKFKCYLTHELDDIKAARNSISKFIDYLKESKRFISDNLSYNDLFENMGLKKHFSPMLPSFYFDWVARGNNRSIGSILSLIEDLYASKRVIVSGYPNIPDDENYYFFQGIDIENDFWGISVKLIMMDPSTNIIRNIIYSNVDNIEENNIRSDFHAKYYFHTINPDKKHKYDELRTRSKHYSLLSNSEQKLFTTGYKDTYRITINFF